jgi:carbon storage regulator
MLVLTRKHQEKIRIGDNIVITVLRTKGKAVRLGIEAPTDVPVIRGELTFDAAAHYGEEHLAEAAAKLLTAAVAESSRTESHASRTPAAWSAKSEPTLAQDRVPGTTPRVSLQRVSRSDLNKVLPGLASPAGPLRAMMERRSLNS